MPPLYTTLLYATTFFFLLSAKPRRRLTFAAAFTTEPMLTQVRDKLGPDYLKVFGEDAGKFGAASVACFTPEALRRAMDGIAAAGADECFLVPTTADPAELDRTRDALGL